MNPPLERSNRETADRTRLAWATWPADLATPVGVFLALRARGHRTCLLESVEGRGRLARYSFVAVDPVASFRAGPGGNELRIGETRTELPGDALDALRQAARERPGAVAPADLPPFCGGWVGWFAYEFASALEPRVPRKPTADEHDVCLDLYEDVLAFDHAEQRVVVMTRSSAKDHDAAIARIEALAADAFTPPDSGTGADAGVAARSGDLRLAGELESLTDPETFRAGVRELKRNIAEGEIFQAVLSQRFEQRFEGDPFTLYRVLRMTNPSPHMFFFEADGTTLIGSSPERLVAVRGKHAENRPIAGTRPRGATPAEDERLGAELAADRKELAEHDMLVDLARNDLGRVARIGTVRVAEHAVLERFARVQHLTSRVECELCDGADALDVLAASFPAGTVSGAPKIRAMELIEGLETVPRGPYGGAFGYLDGAGNLDTALVIRSFVVRDGRLAVQAGAGIVADSDPQKEFEETLHKARALIEAARKADSDAFRSSSPSPARGASRTEIPT